MLQNIILTLEKTKTLFQKQRLLLIGLLGKLYLATSDHLKRLSKKLKKRKYFKLS